MGMGPGGYVGGLYRVLPTQPPSTLLEEQAPPPTSDRRERALPQAGWVGSRLGPDVPVFGGGHGSPPLRGPVLPLQGTPWEPLEMPPLGQ